MEEIGKRWKKLIKNRLVCKELMKYGSGQKDTFPSLVGSYYSLLSWVMILQYRLLEALYAGKRIMHWCLLKDKKKANTYPTER